jgi:hypothetical protein
MNRRSSIRNMTLSAGGLLAIPAWLKAWNRENIYSLPGIWEIHEQKTLTAIADTIIPTKDGIGAKGLGVDLFLEKLFPNCYDSATNQLIKDQLHSLNQKAQSSYQQDFSLLAQGEREELLLNLATSEVKAEKDFFNLLKSETIRGFNTSEKIMTTYLHYQIAPGHYHGCVDLAG